MFVATREEKRKLVGVITKGGALVKPSRTPFIKDKGYPCHIIHENGVSLTTGNLRYWLSAGGSTGVYEGDTFEIVRKQHETES